MTQIVVGVDAGGTRTRVIIGDGHAILTRAEGGAGGIRPGRALAAAAAIAETVRRALAEAGVLEAHAMVVGAAGAGREAARGELEHALRGERIATRVTVTTDIAIALAAAFGRGPGIVLSAGTGSIAMARLEDGSLRRSGGYGWQMGDEGSGYAIARAGLGAVSRAADGRGPGTALTAPLLAAARCETLDELVAWAVNATTAEVSNLAATVLGVAQEGDAVAQGILDYAARELCLMVESLLTHFPGDVRVQVGLAGGLLSAEQPLRARVVKRLSENHRLDVLGYTIEPALGALHLAEQE